MPKQYIACPTCGSTSGFTSAERILATADVNSFSLDDSGKPTPDYAGESEVHWDTQEQIETLPYQCDNCRAEFSDPVVCSHSQLSAIRKQWKTLQAVAHV